MAGAPAFTAVYIESLADSLVASGVPRAAANKLAAATVEGSAALLTGGEAAAVGSTLALKEMVCSPGGTTIRGIEALEQHGFRFAAFAALQAATRRSQELARDAAKAAERERAVHKQHESKL